MRKNLIVAFPIIITLGLLIACGIPQEQIELQESELWHSFGVANYFELRIKNKSQIATLDYMELRLDFFDGSGKQVDMCFVTVQEMMVPPKSVRHFKVPIEGVDELPGGFTWKHRIVKTKASYLPNLFKFNFEL